MENEKLMQIIKEIKKITATWNVDNISRTVFYNNFYNEHPEIKWAFLASMVSRNAGWSMSDLKGEWFPRVLEEDQLQHLFLTYERANWTIFHDAAPQLLLYAKSKESNESIMHYCRAFDVSEFMLEEWESFLLTRDEKRLMFALIINEQHVIEEPLLQHHLYAKKVFRSMVFTVQDWFHFSTVLFPTVKGSLYGLSVSGFRHTKNRIELGKKLGSLLFHPLYFKGFYHFSATVHPTGSRYDYERYMGKRREGPMVRMVYPIIQHHQEEKTNWYRGQRYVQKLLNTEVTLPDKIEVTDWYEGKRSQIRIGIEFENLLKQKHRE
ncbi:DUF2515 family protein [Pseudalkalibacillus hwajinpoensis]|uniref:DUF2515 family protein n=1 Tax=Guptibacillus hwajinpoensis TaxID=208199 RepID=UPI001F10A34D|nr:DUF2515 family protein [Pseudalkalibacillus hwajinpoensis]